ncbi:MAG: glycine oxidase ThiO [Candidatus Dormibacteria bacterium]
MISRNVVTPRGRDAVLDVAIVGGGVIGLAIAWRAAAAGLVTAVFDPAPGSGASHVAAGMLGPVSEATMGETALLALSLASSRRYPDFVAELEEAGGGFCGYRPGGTLLVARDQDDSAVLDRGLRFRQSLGLPGQRLTARECRQLEPGLAPSIRAGVLIEDDHQVDPRQLIAALLAACRRAGVQIIRHRATVVMAGQSVGGVRCDDGRTFSSERVVLAAGCWSASVEGIPAAALPPVRPVKGQILRLSGVAGTVTGKRVIRGIDAYLVPRGDGRVVVGATVEERGFDTTVTAGAAYELLRDARELIPEVTELELVEASAGLRPGSPDNAPMIGESSLPGLLIATGHYRNGVLLAPVTADVITAMLRGEAAPDLARPFSPLRFRRAPEAVA